MKQLILGHIKSQRYDIDYLIATIHECAKLHGSISTLHCNYSDNNIIAFSIKDETCVNFTLGAYLAVFYLLSKDEIQDLIDICFSYKQNYIRIKLIIHDIDGVIKYLED